MTIGSGMPFAALPDFAEAAGSEKYSTYLYFWSGEYQEEYFRIFLYNLFKAFKNYLGCTNYLKFTFNMCIIKSLFGDDVSLAFIIIRTNNVEECFCIYDYFLGILHMHCFSKCIFQRVCSMCVHRKRWLGWHRLYHHSPLDTVPQRGVSVNAVHMNNNKECTYSLWVYLTDIIHETDTGLQLALASYGNLSGNTRDISSISTWQLPKDDTQSLNPFSVDKTKEQIKEWFTQDLRRGLFLDWMFYCVLYCLRVETV